MPRPVSLIPHNPLLAPADLPNEGTGHDLAIAVAMLAASDQLDATRLAGTALIGELALDGSLRRVPGAIALVSAAQQAGACDVIVPLDNGSESAAVGGIVVRPTHSFSSVVRHLAGVEEIPSVDALPASMIRNADDDAPNLGSIIGQRVARRLLEIGIAGQHNLAFSGPPGVGKTLLTRAGAGILPSLSDAEAAEVNRIHSVAGVGESRSPDSRRRPFRAPHHTISTQALVGGGPRIRPGEASLAHRAALLLDETLQFRADALDALRGPIDAGMVTIARVEGVRSLPARFMLLAAYNPCPCGWFAVPGRDCACEDGARRRYQARLSGPMRDRLDLVAHLEPSTLGRGSPVPESTAIVGARVAEAWAVQQERQAMGNAALPAEEIDERHGFARSFLDVLGQRGRHLGLSMRRLHRAARVARTIADLEGSSVVHAHHLDEALLHRPKEVRA